MSDTATHSEHRRLAFNTVAGVAGNVVKVVLQLLLLPVMARLLGPTEYGLYALALPVVTFLAVLADGGLGQSLAREDESDRLVWSSAFWFLLATCTLMAIGATGVGYVLGRLSGEPRLGALTGVLAFSFVLLALSIPPAARIIRRGNLVYFSVGDMVSNVVGSGVAVYMAYRGFGAWSLAAQYLLGFAIRAVLINVIAFVPPSFRFSLSALKPHFAMGSSIMGGRLAEFAGRSLENLAFGKAFGTAALGTFNFANQASKFLSEAPSSPLWSALYSHALRNGGEAVANLHVRLTRLFATFLFPCAFLVSASAGHVLHFALGDKWLAAAPLLSIVVPFYAMNAVASQSGAILLANGRNAVMFWNVSGLAVARLAAVTAAFWTGQITVCWLLDIANIGFSVAIVSSMRSVFPDSPRRILAATAPSFVASALAGGVTFLLLRGVPLDDMFHAAVAVAAGGLSYLVLMSLLEGRLLLADFNQIGRTVLRRA